ncbi:MAG: hypothetical protein KAX49_11570 [Halanaerobiales bacterium]|nr:hypothetical protein [Halanaerobiales bacterium]
MNQLSTLYLRFESKIKTPNEDAVIDGINQACHLGCQEIRITGDPINDENIFFKVLEIIKNKKLKISFDLSQDYITNELIQELNSMNNIYNFAINITGDLAVRKSICYEGLIANIFLDSTNIYKAEESIKSLLDKYKFLRVKIITSIRSLGSIDVYLDLVNTLQTMHKIYKDRLYAMIPWCLLDLSTLTLGRTVCQYQRAVGVFLDGAVTVCGVSRNIKEPTNSLVDLSLKEILEKDPFLCQLRETTPETITGVCQSCVFKNYCANLCPANVYNETGHFNNSYTICQILYDNGRFPVNCLIE